MINILFYIKVNNESCCLNFPELIIEEYKNIFELLNHVKTLDVFNKKNKIENIFILISIFPFIKEAIIITKKHPIYDFYKYIFDIKDNNLMLVGENVLKNFSKKFKDLLYYKWEYLTNNNNTNYIRHILYHYYPEEYASIYEEALNSNIENYIDNNKDKLSYEIIKNSICKN